VCVHESHRVKFVSVTSCTQFVTHTHKCVPHTQSRLCVSVRVGLGVRACLRV